MKTPLNLLPLCPCSIADGYIDSAMKLLVLAPHPDDFDAIGATLKFLFSNNNPLEVAVAYTGSGVEDTIVLD